jgi:hypothetical protein
MRPVGEAVEKAAQQKAVEAAATFRAAVAELEAERDRLGALRQELTFEEVPAPKRLAPYAVAIAATVRRDGNDVAWGRLVLLYDPAGQPGWGGPFRVTAYLRAEVDAEIADDPLLGQVGWSWLTEALDARAPGYEAPSGTVTRVITEGFGGKQDEPPLTGFELRASWSPAPPCSGAAEGVELAGHLAACCDALCASAGLPPLASGVHTLPPSPSPARSATKGRW